ncbi:cfem domain-containing protein [Colletotrichum incanum]|uniref:Cfem domain-containing protein n=1 Tax=Colletotrichum incanum TaxID=1573173 RepID=A0A167DZT5_COLIC|nr:cfem domain-containing protein [Colletotrichum incanum]OHX01181.1 CFEM domain-containing protein [Colletotrichum incanum]
MKYSYVLLATAGMAIAQQKFTDVIPKCSVECLTKAVKDGTKCSSIDDSACICEATNYRNIYTVGVPCVLQACSSEVATGELLPAAAQFCREVTNGASAPPVESASASASASGSAVASGATASPTITVTPTARASGVTASGAATTTAQPAAAAAMGSMGAFGMLALGALAAF